LGVRYFASKVQLETMTAMVEVLGENLPTEFHESLNIIREALDKILDKQMLCLSTKKEWKEFLKKIKVQDV